MAFLPCSLLLDAVLPTDSILCEDAALRTWNDYEREVSKHRKLMTEQTALFCELRGGRELTESRHYWDRATRLAVAVIKRSWNDAHFLLQHVPGTDWVDEEGMGCFRTALSALRLAPPPSVLGPLHYGDLLDRWSSRRSRMSDVRSALSLRPACAGSTWSLSWQTRNL